jgi:hypothetical protein
MPARTRTRSRLRSALAPAVFLAAAVGFTVRAQPPEPAKTPDPPAKSAPKDKDLPVVKLPDGTYLWVGTPGDGTDRVTLTPQEFQKLLDQLDQLKKQLAVKKAVAPSGCAVRGRVEKRGEQLVAVLKFTCTFRTTQPQTPVALVGRRGFLVAAALDGNKLPVLDTTEDGFAALVETAGDHALTLDLEAPVTARGAKPELGFEIGLPRAPITTLVFDPPGPDVKRVNLTTRTPDPAQPARPPEPRRTPALDVKQLAPKSGQDGYPLGAVDSLEVTWDPPAAAAQPADQAQSAEIDVAVQLTEGVVEATAKFKLRGTGRDWKVVAPASADVSVERAAGTGAEVGPSQPPSVTKPADPNKPVWKIELPAGSSAADWVVTAVTRQLRPRPDDAQHRGPFAVGPFAVLEVLRQTGTVLVKGAPHTRFSFKHGPDLRRAEPPARADPLMPGEDELTTAFFRLTSGPTGAAPVNAPLLTVEARPQEGAVKVAPTYQLSLTDAGWRVRAEVKVSPLRTEVEALAVEVPAEWRGFEASPPEVVEGVQPGGPEGFWGATAARLAGGGRGGVVVRLAGGPHKQPFDLVFTATVPVEPGESGAAVPLLRFSDAKEAGTTVTATVPDGLEVRGETRGWDAEFAAWGPPLAAAPGADGEAAKAVTAITGRGETGLSRVVLGWNPYRPSLTAEVRADVTLGERQMVVAQQIRLRSAEGLPRLIRFRGPREAARVQATRPAVFDPAGSGEWTVTAPEGKDFTLSVTFAVPLPPRPDGESAAWDIPVGLLWPAGATRSDVTVRVWSGAATGWVLTAASPGWRELPAEPAPDRDALPALTLGAAGEQVLVLSARPAADPAAVAVWVERGLVQAWGTDDGPTSYRGRFLVRRWLTPSVEVRLPGPLAGPNPEFLRDGLKVDAVPVPEGGPGRSFRVPLPEAKPGAAVVIEVRYQLPAARQTGEAVYHPPLLPAAAFTGPVRWQITVPGTSVPLLTGGAAPEFRWRLRPTGLTPAPAAAADELDRWFRGGDEAAGGSGPDAAGEAVTARQVRPAAVTVYRAPRVALVIACSVTAFVVVLVLWRLPGAIVGPAVAVVAGGLGVAAVLVPHAAAQAAGACQPGLAAALVALVVVAVARASYRRRVTRLPGFSRGLPDTPPPAVTRGSGRQAPAEVAPTSVKTGPPHGTGRSSGKQAPAAEIGG